MIITNLSTSPIINISVNLRDFSNHIGGRSSCVQVLATGVVSSGVPKLTVSFDNQNFYPLRDETNAQVGLASGVPVFLDFVNAYIKVDLTGVVSEDLRVEVQ